MSGTDDSTQIALLRATIQSNHDATNLRLDGIQTLLTSKLTNIEERHEEHREALDQKFRHERNNRETAETALKAEIDKKPDTDVVETRIKHLEEKLAKKVDLADFSPVKAVVYGIVSIFLTAVAVGLLALVITRPA
ncbi:MAG TPA: hypothetical protein VGB79_01695 [Allosphingosinicella sp.]|jgi:hypothetical protein